MLQKMGQPSCVPRASRGAGNMLTHPSRLKRLEMAWGGNPPHLGMSSILTPVMPLAEV